MDRRVCWSVASSLSPALPGTPWWREAHSEGLGAATAQDA